MPKTEKDLEKASEIARIKAQRKENNELELGLRETFNTENGDAPIVTAIGIQRVKNHFSFVEYTIQGDKVLEVKADEPNMRQIAVDCFKIRASKLFID